MNSEIVMFINGLIIGIIGTLIFVKIYVEHKARQMENEIRNAIDKLLEESKFDEIPIEKEEEEIL